MFGVSYQAYGSARLTGIRPRRPRCRRARQCPKLGNETTATRPTRIISRSTSAGRCVAWSVWESTTTSKDPSSKSGRPSSMSACTTGIPRMRQAWKASGESSTPCPRQPRADQLGQQVAVAAAQVEHPRSARDHVGHDAEVGPHRPAAPAPTRSRNAGHGAVVLRDLEQERVVAVRRGDLAEGHRHLVGGERADDLARVGGVEAPVAVERDHEEARRRCRRAPARWRPGRRRRRSSP